MSILPYGQIIADRVRMDAYRLALARSVFPGSVVVDLGAGAGIMSFIAARLGAASVHAIEPDDVIDVARRIAVTNGFAGRIHFHQCLSQRLDLPEPADVIVADLRGALPAFEGHFDTIADARTRFLKPGGVLIPCRDTLWVAPVEAPDVYARHMQGWETGEFDMSAARALAVNSWSKSAFKGEQLLSKAGCWAEVDYRTVSGSGLQGTAALNVTRRGWCHGLAVWFDALLVDDIEFSNAPGLPDTVYGRGFFPIPNPLPVDVGCSVFVTLRADLVRSDYVWSWDTEIRFPDGRETRSRQSTFHGLPLSLERLQRQEATFVPRLNRTGEVEKAILLLFGSGKTVEQIASEIAARFPARFTDPTAAFALVAQLSATYGE